MNAKRTRRGRLPTGEREARRRQVLDAAAAELVENGYAATTMLSIARRAGASKETLYAWFDGKAGLIGELIATNADGAAARIQTALEQPSDVRAILEQFSVGLLSLLVSPESIALNQAAMADPELAAALLAGGRHRVGPLVEAYLEQACAAGDIDVADSAVAFEELYGLVIRDTQIRVLLGEPPPDRPAILARAQHGVDAFLALHATTR